MMTNTRIDRFRPLGILLSFAMLLVLAACGTQEELEACMINAETDTEIAKCEATYGDRKSDDSSSGGDTTITISDSFNTTYNTINEIFVSCAEAGYNCKQRDNKVYIFDGAIRPENCLRICSPNRKDVFNCRKPDKYENGSAMVNVTVDVVVNGGSGSGGGSSSGGNTQVADVRQGDDSSSAVVSDSGNSRSVVRSVLRWTDSFNPVAAAHAQQRQDNTSVNDNRSEANPVAVAEANNEGITVVQEQHAPVTIVEGDTIVNEGDTIVVEGDTIVNEGDTIYVNNNYYTLWAVEGDTIILFRDGDKFILDPSTGILTSLCEACDACRAAGDCGPTIGAICDRECPVGPGPGPGASATPVTPPSPTVVVPPSATPVPDPTETPAPAPTALPTTVSEPCYDMPFHGPFDWWTVPASKTQPWFAKGDVEYSMPGMGGNLYDNSPEEWGIKDAAGNAISHIETGTLLTMDRNVGLRGNWGANVGCLAKRPDGVSGLINEMQTSGCGPSGCKAVRHYHIEEDGTLTHVADYVR